MICDGDVGKPCRWYVERDHALHMVKHSKEEVKTANFKIIDKSFSNNKRKSKIAVWNYLFVSKTETYTECIDDANASKALWLNNQ